MIRGYLAEDEMPEREPARRDTRPNHFRDTGQRCEWLSLRWNPPMRNHRTARHIAAANVNKGGR